MRDLEEGVAYELSTWWGWTFLVLEWSPTRARVLTLTVDGPYDLLRPGVETVVASARWLEMMSKEAERLG